MTRKRVLIIGASAVIVGGLVYFFIRENVGSEREVQAIHRSLSDQINVSKHAARLPQRMRAELKEKTALDAKSIERNNKVQAALEKFKARTDHMSREQILMEFERVSEKKKEFEARPTSKPKEELFIDDEGLHWKKLIYENGAVRYELEEG